MTKRAFLTPHEAKEATLEDQSPTCFHPQSCVSDAREEEERSVSQ